MKSPSINGLNSSSGIILGRHWGVLCIVAGATLLSSVVAAQQQQSQQPNAQQQGGQIQRQVPVNQAQNRAAESAIRQVVPSIPPGAILQPPPGMEVSRAIVTQNGQQITVFAPVGAGQGQGQSGVTPQGQVQGLPPGVTAIANGSDSAPAENGGAADIQELMMRGLLEQSFGMPPEMIRRYRKHMFETEAEQISIPPSTTVNTTRNVSFDIGSKPEVINIAPGRVSGVSFFDVTGSPWPIAAVQVGLADYEIQQPKGESAYFTIAPKKTMGADTDLIVYLKGQSVPLSFLIKGGQNKTHNARVDVKIASRGPGASTPALVDQGPSRPGGDLMQSFADGIAIAGASPLVLARAEDGMVISDPRERQVTANKKQPPVPHDPSLGQAWLSDSQDGASGSRLYYRAPPDIMLISPSWSSTVKGPNATVYELPDVPLLLAQKNGQPIRIRVRRFGER